MHSHERAGILTLIVLIVLAILSGIIQGRSRGRRIGFVRLRAAILVFATVSLGMVLWTSRLGGELQHSELKFGSQTASVTSHR